MSLYLTFISLSDVFYNREVTGVLNAPLNGCTFLFNLDLHVENVNERSVMVSFCFSVVSYLFISLTDDFNNREVTGVLNAPLHGGICL